MPSAPSPLSLMSGITLSPGHRGPVVYTSSPAPAHNPHHGLASNGVHMVTNGGPSSSQSGKHCTMIWGWGYTYDYISVPPSQPVPLKQEIVEKDEVKEESQPEVDIVINNVVCSFSVRCHLNLKEIALNGSNVEYRRENGMVTMKLR